MRFSNSIFHLQRCSTVVNLLVIDSFDDKDFTSSSTAMKNIRELHYNRIDCDVSFLLAGN